MITYYLTGCLVALVLTMLLDTIEFRSGVHKQPYEYKTILGAMTLCSWVGVAVATFGLTLYVYDTYKEIYSK